MKLTLPIGALGPMVTRFVPGGNWPLLVGESPEDRIRRAVEGLEGFIDGYELYYPYAVDEENVDKIQTVLGGHDIYILANALHPDPRFKTGGLTSPDKATRAEAMRRTLACADLAGYVGANMIMWPGNEGYNYPFQVSYRQSWRLLLDGLGEAAQRCKAHGIRLFLEAKSSEPALKVLLRNVGVSLSVAKTLRGQGLDNVSVNLDWQNVIMTGESIAESAALLEAEGMLGHQHASSGWGFLDDKTMVGSLNFMETLELAVEMRDSSYAESGGRLGFDIYPYTEEGVSAVRRSVEQWRSIERIAARVDLAALTEARDAHDAVRAYEVIYTALQA
ncbi:MAG: TIM barrel protein [Streptosporangiaceae bacterium]